MGAWWWKPKLRLLPQGDPPDVLRRLGFRCIEPVSFRLRDGSEAVVHASGWMLAEKELPATDAEAGCLRLYTVYYPGYGTEELDEHDVAALVGREAWERAA